MIPLASNLHQEKHFVGLFCWGFGLFCFDFFVTIGNGFHKQKKSLPGSHV